MSKENKLLPTRGLLFKATRMSKEISDTRPNPNFSIIWDDLNGMQKKFLMVTHGMPENANIRDKLIIGKIKQLLYKDDIMWKESKIPFYTQIQTDAITTYNSFMEVMPMIHQIFNKRGMTMDEQSTLCSQLEVLTDMFFCARPNFTQLTLTEQNNWLTEYQSILNYRKAMVALIESSISTSRPNASLSGQSLLRPSAFSTPKTTVFRQSDLYPSFGSLANINARNTITTSLPEIFCPTNWQYRERVEETLHSLTKMDISEDESIKNSTIIRKTDEKNNETPPTTQQTICPDKTDFPVVSVQLDSTRLNTPPGMSLIPSTTTETTTTVNSSMGPKICSKEFENLALDIAREQNLSREIDLNQNNTNTLRSFLQQTTDEKYLSCQSNYENNTKRVDDESDSFSQSINKLRNFRDKRYDFISTRGESYQPNEVRQQNWRRGQQEQRNRIIDTNRLKPNLNHDQGTGETHEKIDNLQPNNYRSNFHQNPSDALPLDHNQQFPDAQNFTNSARSNDNNLEQLLLRVLSLQGNRNNSNLPKLNDWHPKFSGSDDCSLIDVLTQWERLASNCNMSPEVLLYQIHMLLRGEALRWHNSIGVDILHWTRYKEAIVNRFQSKDKITATFMTSANDQRVNEKFDNYYARMRMLMKQSAGELTEKQLVTRLLTGLKDTRCRDVIRNNSSGSMGVNWSKIINNINQIEVEYDLISRSKQNYANENVRKSFATGDSNRENTLRNLERFNKNSSDVKRNTNKTEKTTDSKDTQPKIASTTQRNDYTRLKENFYKKFKSNNNHKAACVREEQDIQEENFEYASDDLIDEVNDHKLMMMDIFENSEWNEDEIESFMAVQRCSNCDIEGHTIEMCKKLFDERKFKNQCTICHLRDVDTTNCPICTKN